MKTVLLAVALSAFAATVAADSPVEVSTVITYAEGIGTEDLRTGCDWNPKLAGFIVEYSKGGAVLADSPTPAARHLDIRITNVHAVGGGPWSGPKWAILHGELREGEKVVGSFEAKRTSAGAGLMTGCSALGHISKALAKDIATWLSAPTMDARLGDAPKN